MHQLPNITAQATYSTVTAWIWVLGLILQIILFIALFNRRIAPAYPLFTVFVGFYLIRSVFLYLSFDYVSRQTYGRLYNFLLLFDILIQLGLATELCAALIRSMDGWTTNRLLYVTGITLLAALGTWLAVSVMPHTSIRLDRSQLFFSIIAISLLIASLHSSNGLFRTIAQGWGIFGIVSFTADIGRVVAGAGNHPRTYAAWSYALATTYLIVVVFWLAMLRSNKGVDASTRKSLA